MSSPLLTRAKMADTSREPSPGPHCPTFTRFTDVSSPGSPKPVYRATSTSSIESLPPICITSDYRFVDSAADCQFEGKCF